MIILTDKLWKKPMSGSRTVRQHKIPMLTIASNFEILQRHSLVYKLLFLESVSGFPDSKMISKVGMIEKDIHPKNRNDRFARGSMEGALRVSTHLSTGLRQTHAKSQHAKLMRR